MAESEIGIPEETSGEVCNDVGGRNFSRIQDDIIELTDGVYTGSGNRDLNNSGKYFLIRSQSGDPTACIIDLQGTAEEPHRGITYAEDG